MGRYYQTLLITRSNYLMLQVVAEVMLGLEPVGMCGYIGCNNKHYHQGYCQQRNKEYG